MWKKILILSLAVLAIISVRAEDNNDVAIIVGKSSGLDTVTSADLAKILRAEKAKGPDGVKFVLSTRDPGSPEREAVLREVYKMSDADYTKFFLQATFTGAVQSAPRQISSAAAAKQFVAATPGAISYIKASDADDSVKVVKIDGKAPGEAGYPLKLK